MSPGRAWRPERPSDDAWRPRGGLSQDERAREQDDAAGGRAARHVQLPDGREALASIALRAPARGRRIYAYLRWSDNGTTAERYVAEVNEASREANLAAAWAMHHVSSTRPGTGQPPVGAC